MQHKPIHINSLSLTFPHKICFEDFSTQIFYGNRIAVIGRNGSGKTSLLKMLSTDILLPEDIRIANVPQLIELDGSGGERFNRALTQALAQKPNLLTLDEPTNHLDRNNRTSLLRMLHTYPGTVIIASHDPELLRTCHTFWHIDHGSIYVFSGDYDDYQAEIQRQRASTEHALARLHREKKETHEALMKEQIRASKSRVKGEKSIAQNKWPTITSNAKALRAQETSGRKRAAIDNRKQKLSDQLADLRLPEVIVPTFSITRADIREGVLLSIRDGSVSYKKESCRPERNAVESNGPWFYYKNKTHSTRAKALAQGDTHLINLTLSTHDRIAIRGNNGSGKTTILKAILNDPSIIKTGDWQLPSKKNIGYLDQHYQTLNPNKTVFETIADLWPESSHQDIRKLLTQFLFRKNEEVNAFTSTLSGGEKARLCLAQISACTPKLLILDELTNNLDLETREHVIEVLKIYPGAIIVVSHDENFLASMNATNSLIL